MFIRALNYNIFIQNQTELKRDFHHYNSVENTTPSPFAQAKNIDNEYPKIPSVISEP